MPLIKDGLAWCVLYCLRGSQYLLLVSYPTASARPSLAHVAGAAAGAAISMQLLLAPIASAEFRLPPIDNGASWGASYACMCACHPLVSACVFMMSMLWMPCIVPEYANGHDAPVVMSTPLHADPNRCDRGYIGNTIGQANAVSGEQNGAFFSLVLFQ